MKKSPVSGDHVILEMKGELARQYSARAFGPVGETNGVSISTVATVQQRQPDGRYQIVDQSILKAGDKTKMLLLTAVVGPADIREQITPAETLVYASPDEHRNASKPVKTTVESRSLRVELSKLENVKLQTWELVDEIGK